MCVSFDVAWSGLDRTLSVRIDVPQHAEEVGTGFPLAQAGNPTINARLLVEDA